jgi:hypothetical protein
MNNWDIALAVVLTFGVIFFVLNRGAVIEKLKVTGLLDVAFAPKPAAPPRPVATRDFIVGRWEVDQQLAPNYFGGTSVVYYKDGTLKGWADRFVDNAGTREQWAGTWDIKVLADDQFQLKATLNGAPYEFTFRIFDKDHIQNVDNNYIAVRMP